MLRSNFIAYIKQNGTRAASQNFYVDDKCVRQWCDQKEELAAINKTRKALHSKPCEFPKLEKELMKYVTDIRKDGYALSTEMLRAKALAIAHHMNISPTRQARDGSGDL